MHLCVRVLTGKPVLDRPCLDGVWVVVEEVQDGSRTCVVS